MPQVENHMVQAPYYDDVYPDETREPEEVQEDAYEDFHEVYKTEFNYVKEHIKNKKLVFGDIGDIEAVLHTIEELLHVAEFWEYESFTFNFTKDVTKWVESL
jgi:hypothetical protein